MKPPPPAFVLRLFWGKGRPWRNRFEGPQASLPHPPPEILAMEEEVAQSLLDAKERAHQGGVELQQLQAELQKAGEDNTRLKASLLYPSLCVRGRRISGLGARGPGPPTAGISAGSPPPERGDLNRMLYSAHPRAGGAQGDRGQSGETGEGS